MIKFRRFYAVIATIILLVEILIALFLHHGFIRYYVGDFLVVILIYCFIRSLFKWNICLTAVAVLLFSYLVEFLQFFKIVEKLHVQHSKFARIIIGTSFAWVDILAYTLGIIFVLIIETFIRKYVQPRN